LRELENRALSRIPGPKKEELVRGWRRLHNELHILHASPNIIRVMKPRRMTGKGHKARTGEMRNVYKILIGRPEGKRPLGDLGVDGREDNIGMSLRVTW